MRAVEPMRARSKIVAALAPLAMLLGVGALPQAARAQWWENVPRTIPLDAKGEPNLAAPAPRTKDGPIQWLRVGFKGTTLAALEIADAFGQRSLLRFSALEQNVKLPDSTFEFTPPKGADVIEQ